MRCVAPVLAGIGLVAVMTAPSAGAKRIGPIDLVSQAGIRIVGEAASDRVGWAVARAGDVNGDRRMDVIIGAPAAANNERDSSGSAYVVFGQRSAATIDLASLGGGGFRIDGASQGDNAGFAVSTAGDVNGDGLADVVVGAPEADNNLREQSGSAYVVFGQRTSAPGRPLGARRSRLPHRRRVELRVRRLVGRGRRRRQRRQEARCARGRAVRRQRRARLRAGGIRAEPGRLALRRLRPGRGHERRSRRPREPRLSYRRPGAGEPRRLVGSAGRRRES